MPVLPVMPLPGSGEVDPAEWYDTGLYAPANPADTLEILDGGQDEDNYVGGDDSIPMEMVQIGTFALAGYAGFRRWQFLYGRGFNMDESVPPGSRYAARQVVAGLAFTFSLPFDVSFLWFGFQAYCRQDATVWDTNGNGTAPPMPGPLYEFWDMRTYLDTEELESLYAKLPHGRQTAGTPDSSDPTGDPDGFLDPGMHAENRWRYVSRIALNQGGAHTSKGTHRLRVTAWPRLYKNDASRSKLILPTGGITVCAIR